MTDSQKFLVFLSLFELSPLKNKQIIDFMGNDLSIKKFKKTKFSEDVITADAYLKMLEKADEARIENFIQNTQNQDIKIITKLDDEYPEKLKYFDDSPICLYYKGDLTLLEKSSLAVVGTRKPSNYGIIVTKKLCDEVASAGVVIISGLAYGVDSLAHRECLDVGGKTIAVLVSGINEIYPAAHVGLAAEIADKGLLISEYPPNKKATKYSFPQRNRIIAGLCDGVLITEAGFKSGTIHTKDYALEYGKEIYSVPGNILNDKSELTNDIIKSGQAYCVTSAQDILGNYKLEKTASNKKEIQLSIEEQQIVSLLEDGIKEIDFLSKNSNLSINIFNSCLTTLEIRGIISRLPGGFVSLN